MMFLATGPDLGPGDRLAGRTQTSARCNFYAKLHMCWHFDQLVKVAMLQHDVLRGFVCELFTLLLLVLLLLLPLLVLLFVLLLDELMPTLPLRLPNEFGSSSKTRHVPDCCCGNCCICSWR